MAYAYRVKVGADTSSLTDITSYIDLESFSLSSNFDDRLPRCEFGMIDDWKATGGTAPVTLRLWWVVQVERSAIGDWSDTDVRFIGVITGIDRAQVGSGNLVAVTASGWKIVLTTDILTGDSYKWGTVGSQSYFHTSEESNVTYTILSNDNSAPTDKIPKMFYDLDTAHTWKMDANNPTITTNKLFDLRGKSVAEAMDEICDALELNWTINWDGSGNKTVIVQKNAYSGQKITNPEFENTTGGWTYTSSARTAGAGRSAAATDYGWLSTSAAGLCTQTVGATAGVRYLLLANLGAKRGSSGNTSVTLNMNWKNSGGTTISTTTTSYTSTSTSLTWAYKELIATAPVGTTQVQIELDAGGTFTGGGQVNADNIYMIEQTAPFGISWTPDDSSTYAPQEWSEPVQAEQPINKVYIYGDTTAARGWYSNYASYAYFNRWFEGYESDTEIKTQSQAEERSRKIFSEHAFPRVEGSYTIHQHGLVAGQNQIIENAITQQNAVFTIVGIEERPIGSGKVEYKVSYGAHPRNRYTQIITAMSGVTPTSNPTSSAPKNSPAVSAPMMTKSVGWATVAAASVAATSGVSDFPNVETLAPQNRQPLVVQRTSGQTDANALAAATLPYEELPAGRMTLVVPETGVTTQPALYRVNSAGSAWEAVTPADLRATAIANGTLSQGMIVAESIVAGTIDASVITVDNINAGNIKSGTLTATAANGVAINAGSGKFTVDSSGNVLANSITLGATATVSNSAGNEVTGSIYSRPGDNVTSAQFRLVADASNNLTKSVTGITSSGAAANANCTINATAHPFSAGQFIWFTGATGSGAAVLNAITESLPAQIISTTTNAFVINYYLAIGAITGGTATAGKRLSVVAPSGTFIYQSDSKPGALATGSIALGSSLTKLGKGSTATLADGEIGFLTSAGGTNQPRYVGGANLYSPDGTSTVATSGDFQLGASSSSTAGAIVFKNGAGGSVRPFSATAGNTSLAIKNSDGSAYTALVASGFYPGGQGTANLNHDGTQFTLNDTVSVTGNLTTSGTLNSSNLPSYVRSAVSTASTTSIAAQGFQDHTVTYTSTGSTPTVVIATVYHSASTSANLVATVWSRTASSATIRIYNAGTAATTSSRQAMVMVGIG